MYSVLWSRGFGRSLVLDDDPTRLKMARLSLGRPAGCRRYVKRQALLIVVAQLPVALVMIWLGVRNCRCVSCPR